MALLPLCKVTSTGPATPGGFPRHFFPREHQPVLKACCARPEEKDKLEKFAKSWGYESMEFDWKKLIARADIDLIDVCVPNVLHHDLVIAAANAGKIVVCEKPLAMHVKEAEEMVAAVEEFGADAIGMSGLLVKSTLIMRENLEELNRRGLSHIPVILGGLFFLLPFMDRGRERRPRPNRPRRRKRVSLQHGR